MYNFHCDLKKIRGEIFEKKLFENKVVRDKANRENGHSEKMLFGKCDSRKWPGNVLHYLERYYCLANIEWILWRFKWTSKTCSSIVSVNAKAELQKKGTWLNVWGLFKFFWITETWIFRQKLTSGNGRKHRMIESNFNEISRNINVSSEVQ